MGLAVKLSDELVNEAKKFSKVFNRSIAGQIEYWAKIGKAVEDNPDLPTNFVRNLLLAMEEVEQGKVHPFELNNLNSL